jgi:hypothetical protein
MLRVCGLCVLTGVIFAALRRAPDLRSALPVAIARLSLLLEMSRRQRRMGDQRQAVEACASHRASLPRAGMSVQPMEAARSTPEVVLPQAKRPVALL